MVSNQVIYTVIREVHGVWELMADPDAPNDYDYSDPGSAADEAKTLSMIDSFCPYAIALKGSLKPIGENVFINGLEAIVKNREVTFVTEGEVSELTDYPGVEPQRIELWQDDQYFGTYFVEEQRGWNDLPDEEDCEDPKRGEYLSASQMKGCENGDFRPENSSEIEDATQARLQASYNAMRFVPVNALNTTEIEIVLRAALNIVRRFNQDPTASIANARVTEASLKRLLGE